MLNIFDVLTQENRVKCVSKINFDTQSFPILTISNDVTAFNQLKR